MPKRLECSAARTIEWVDYEEKPLGTGHIRLKSHNSAAKHGTEMASYKGYHNHRGNFDKDLLCYLPGDSSKRYPAMVGNMVVGEATEVGDGVEGFAVGDRVLSYGCFSETHAIKVDPFVWKVPEDVDWRAAVCMDPAFFALSAVRDGQVRVGDSVAWFGLGAIALCGVQISKLAGASTVIAVDPLEIRREAAKAMGADVVLDPTACDAGLEIKKAAGGRGVDAAIEYSGNHRAMQAAIRGVAWGGNVVAGAYPPPYEAGLDFGAEAHHNIPNIIFSRGCSDPGRDHPRWDTKRIYEACWQLICEGRLSGEHIVDPIVPFDELLNEYPKIADAPETNIKLGVNH